MPADEKLLILLKAPLLGQVKTRMAAEIGADNALAAYRQMLDKVLSTMAPLSVVELHYTPKTELCLVKDISNNRFTYHDQAEGDLGFRILAAFRQAFQAGAKRIAMIGTDCPEVTSLDVQTAWAALKTNDLVLGPAQDGGYWLIGLKEPHPELFTGINWSTATVLTETLTRASQLGLSHHLLQTLSDVDTLADWQAYLARSQAQNLE